MMTAHAASAKPDRSRRAVKHPNPANRPHAMHETERAGNRTSTRGGRAAMGMPDAVPLTVSLPDNDRRAFSVLLCEYLHRLEDLQIVDGVLVGSKAGESQGYLWNVLRSDFELSQARHEPFPSLS